MEIKDIWVMLDRIGLYMQKGDSGWETPVCKWVATCAARAKTLCDYRLSCFVNVKEKEWLRCGLFCRETAVTRRSRWLQNFRCDWLAVKPALCLYPVQSAPVLAHVPQHLLPVDECW